MATYDPEVIQGYADRLYADAAAIVRTYVILGGFVGLIFGGGVGFYLAEQGGPDILRIVGALVLGAIGAAMAYSLGQQKAAGLRLAAQTALCQVEIEKNSRRA